MRSLSAKLILAFLATSLISIAAIVALTRIATSREFTRYVSDQYKSALAAQLANYYQQHQTWDDLAQDAINLNGAHPASDHDHPPFYALANGDGLVVLEDLHHKQGEQISAQSRAQATPIQVNGKTIGYLLLEAPPGAGDPIQHQFLDRLDFSLFVSAIGAIALAFLFGIILSRNITNPVRELTAATHAMAGGKLGQQVIVRSHDEVGELAESFNRMNAELARSSNLRKQMTADIAHELRTPLSLIIGQAEAVHDGVLPPSRENFELIRDEAERLEKLVNDLRTLSLADAGELSVELRRVDVNRLLSDIHTHYQYQFGQKQVTLDLEPAPGILEADLDPLRFSQVIGNVLDNALHYTSEGGHVVIETRAMHDEVEVSIQDDGMGVSAPEAAQLFERFYRADEARARDDGGSGLGLAIAKSIVELHHGSIRAEGESGKGLRVVISLPLAPPRP